MKEEPRAMNPLSFIFKRCQLAAAHNAKILPDANFDLDTVSRNQHPSQLSYGSEFRLSEALEELLSDHPLWDCLKNILENGATFPLQPISDIDCQSDIVYHKERETINPCQSIHPSLIPSSQRTYSAVLRSHFQLKC